MQCDANAVRDLVIQDCAEPEGIKKVVPARVLSKEAECTNGINEITLCILKSGEEDFVKSFIEKEVKTESLDFLKIEQCDLSILEFLRSSVFDNLKTLVMRDGKYTAKLVEGLVHMGFRKFE